jgi:eukaryotic-like serine/threonine-protein kinase
VLPSDNAVLQLLAEHLHGRYQVDREIARGGMANVYLARAPEREDAVAIKVMNPRVAAALGPERFRREIAVARRMEHPLIVPLWDWGEAGDLLYYVMPYVEGETLYERLRRERRLSIAESLRIARDVATALAYAHDHGVMHRDIKPENILLTRQGALVADFGLARAIGGEYTRLTRTGVVVGTVHYMSPEQLREDPDVDQRADVYSLGCILFEMLTGEPPYSATSLKELVTRCLRWPIPSARQLREEVPEAIDLAITRALAKSAQQRFAGMRELIAALGG